MDQHLADPNRPLTVSILRDALNHLEAVVYGDTPISLYAGCSASRLIRPHNITADTSIADRPASPALNFCSTWDTAKQGSAITNFVLL